ncbi:hypothetical protein LTR05_003855 [Lithohypha guttulata]|uniref:HhH-GPD domain-containing protein n=1 Tax=Lithohypha guttulata TaxID=1690604 RepID=A0AAN7T1Q9_9EURO|nr:hypothetical protein LTR05_003855 [Lithohypha guttulata]
MPARKAAATKARKGKEESEAESLLPDSGPSRRSARQANKKWETDYADTGATANGTPTMSPTRGDVKQEEEERTSVTPRKANMSAKRSAPTSPAGQGSAAKRVKFEKGDGGNIEGVKMEFSPASKVDEVVGDDEESGSELSEIKSEDEDEMSEDDFSDDEKPAKKRKSPSTKKTQTKTPPKSKAKSTKKAQKATPDSDPATTPDSKSKKKSSSSTTTSPADKAAALQARKLKEFAQFSNKSPFPDFPHPTPDEARLAHRILAKLHGERVRPKEVVARADVAGCGDSPSVLDALVRTILSQNTSDKNSTRAKLSMDKVYGGSDSWDAIVEGGQAKLQEAIKSGGLSQVKSRVIISILEQVKSKYGEYTLDHLFKKSDEEAMQELISFQGVGPKTASCVLLFCLQRESFAVDTHVYRIAGMLGWRPASATRDETHAHLEVRIPDEDKYGLHILMVGHGKKCDECKAGGKSVGKCELRRAFRQGKLKGEAGQDVKEEEEEVVKKEEDGGEQEGEEEEVKKEEWESGQEDYVHGMQSGKSGSKKQKTSKVKK